MNKTQILTKLKPLWKENKRFKSQRLLIAAIGLGIILLATGIFFSLQMRTDRTGSWQEVTDAYYDPIDVVLYDPDIQLVDIRQTEQFKEGRIKGAINIPVSFEDGDISNKQQVIEQFAKLKTEPQIVIYGKNSYTLQTVRVAQLLENKNIQVKVLRVGWTEFFHFQTFWLPEELSSKVNILNYIELPE